MNELPPTQDEPDDVDEFYRHASGLDPSRPSESVRQAVLKHAAQLAAHRAAQQVPTRIHTRRPAEEGVAATCDIRLARCRRSCRTLGCAAFSR